MERGWKEHPRLWGTFIMPKGQKGSSVLLGSHRKGWVGRGTRLERGSKGGSWGPCAQWGCDSKRRWEALRRAYSLSVICSDVP